MKNSKYIEGLVRPEYMGYEHRQEEERQQYKIKKALTNIIIILSLVLTALAVKVIAVDKQQKQIEVYQQQITELNDFAEVIR